MPLTHNFTALKALLYKGNVTQLLRGVIFAPSLHKHAVLSEQQQISKSHADKDSKLASPANVSVELMTIAEMAWTTPRNADRTLGCV